MPYKQSELERAFETRWKQLAPADVRDKLVPEHRFHPMRKWRFDFVIPEAMVAIELHGGTYSQGRHVRGIGFKKDREKINAAIELGWVVLEYTVDQVGVDPAGVIDQIVLVTRIRLQEI